MIKALALETALPCCTGRIEQIGGAHHIGLDKCIRVGYRTIHMTLRSKVYYAIESIFFEKTFDLGGISDVGFLENVIRWVLDVLKVFQVACIGQSIKVDDRIVGVFVDE